MTLGFSASENCLKISFELIVTEISEAVSFKRMNTPLNPLSRGDRKCDAFSGVC
jgi:hypothetical protein